MPYFYRKDGDKYCVYKGTPKEPGEQLKCYDTPAEAQKYLGALMSNVEDAKKAAGGVSQCVCPECGATAPHQAGTPCRETKCPKCGAMMEAKVSDKATWSTEMVNNLPDSSFLFVEKGDKDDSGKTTPRSKRHLPYKNASGSVDLPHLRNAISRLSQQGTGSGEDSWLTPELRKSLLAKARKVLGSESSTKSSFTVKRQSDGTYRWWSVSSVAIQDKEGETVSEKAYDDAIAYATEVADYGDLDLVHIKGTSIGQCDGMVRLGKLLVESGTIPDTPMSRGVIKAVEADPDYWGVSLKFTYDPEQFNSDTRTYQGGVRIINRTVLPKWMAASYGTAITLEGGTMKMDKDAIEALKALGVPEEKIQELAEQEKSVDPPNVVEKAESDEPESEAEPVEEKATGILKKLTDLLTRMGKPLEQAEKANETAQTEVEAPEPPPVIEIDYDEVTKRASAPILEAVLKSLNEALEPLGPALQAMVTRLEEQDKRLKDLELPIEDQVTKRLAELPPVVKVGATTVVNEAPVQTVAETAPERPETPYSVLMDKIATSVQNAVGQSLDEAKIKI
jgi:hypothetical protein